MPSPCLFLGAARCCLPPGAPTAGGLCDLFASPRPVLWLRAAAQGISVTLTFQIPGVSLQAAPMSPQC